MCLLNERCHVQNEKISMMRMLYYAKAVRWAENQLSDWWLISSATITAAYLIPVNKIKATAQWSIQWLLIQRDVFPEKRELFVLWQPSALNKIEHLYNICRKCVLLRVGLEKFLFALSVNIFLDCSMSHWQLVGLPHSPTLVDYWQNVPTYITYAFSWIFAYMCAEWHCYKYPDP